MALQQNGDVPAALQDYNHAQKLYPKDPVIYDNRGNALNASGKPEEAVADFTHAIALNPRDFTAYSNRAAVLRCWRSIPETRLPPW